jgi:hypothetical protein
MQLTNGKTRGEPGAVKAARRVREGAPGNGQAATPAPRPGAYLTDTIAPATDPHGTAATITRVLGASTQPEPAP